MMDIIVDESREDSKPDLICQRFLLAPSDLCSQYELSDQAPVVQKAINAKQRSNHPNPQNKFIPRLNSVPQSSISTIQGLK